MKSFNPVLPFVLFTLLLAVPPLLLIYTNNTSLLVPNFWLMFVYVTGLTFLSIVFILIIQKVNKEMYAPAFLGATTFKLLTSLIFVLFFIKKCHPEKVSFVVDFIYLYFLNTAFEIYSLLRNLRNQNLK